MPDQNRVDVSDPVPTDFGVYSAASLKSRTAARETRLDSLSSHLTAYYHTAY